MEQKQGEKMLETCNDMKTGLKKKQNIFCLATQECGKVEIKIKVKTCF